MHNLTNYLFVEFDILDVVKDIEQMSLDGMRVASLTKNFQKYGIRHKKEARKQKSFLLQVAEKIMSKMISDPSQ